jgi:Cd2+/Zn2+-exporting ATPase
MFCDRLRYVLEAEGKTSVLVAREATSTVRVLGWLAFTDTLRPGAAEMIADLRALGVEQLVMLTGDNERVARRIADEVGIDEVQAELLLEEKVKTIEDLMSRYENVAMVRGWRQRRTRFCLLPPSSQKVYSSDGPRVIR